LYCIKKLQNVKDMDKLTDLLASINESRIFLDGNEEIEWELLEYHVKNDPNLKGVNDKVIEDILLSVQKWLIDQHWALPGAFPNNQAFNKMKI
jgi:hypothetical protein